MQNDGAPSQHLPQIAEMCERVSPSSGKAPQAYPLVNILHSCFLNTLYNSFFRNNNFAFYEIT